jgi:glycine cleavage system H protein
MAYPAQYRYTREHEWIRVDGIVGEVGITDYAQSSLGDIVYVEAPEVGTNVEKDKVFGSVESVKAVSDLYSPVSGMVTSVNDALSDAPEQINQDAHKAWIVKMQLSKPSQVDSLMTAKEYEQFISEEGSK